METKQKKSVALSLATFKANALLGLLSPFCQKIEIAGSIRRKRNLVGDIEILAVPVYSNFNFGLFSNPSQLNELKKYVTRAFECEKSGEKYIRFEYKGIPVDLFMTSLQDWGRMMAIRTGPESHSKAIAKQWVRLGYHGIDGRLVHDRTGEIPEFLTEKAFYQFLNWPHIIPEART